MSKIERKNVAIAPTNFAVHVCNERIKHPGSCPRSHSRAVINHDASDAVKVDFSPLRGTYGRTHPLRSHLKS